MIRTYRLYTYDLWGNEEDGYQVNDVYRTGDTVDIDDDTPDATVIAMLETAGILEPGACEVSPIGDGGIIYIEDANGNPCCELRSETRD
jgi:hypothetical protein